MSALWSSTTSRRSSTNTLLFAPGTTGDQQIVADEIRRIIDVEPATAQGEASDYGPEIINGA
jgi:hypothetical protein